MRFPGRKIYLESAILLACVIAPLLEEHARAIRRATGIAARTVRRWWAWWRTVFAGSALFVELRARSPGIEAEALPGALLNLYAGEAEERLALAMQFLTPLTSATAWRARSSKVAM